MTRRRVAQALELIGSAVVCIGVAFIYWPAPIIVAGLAAILIPQGLEAQGRKEHPDP